MFQRYLGLVTVLLFSSLTVLAQNGALHGTVKDDQGNKVELVTVAVEGTSFGTTTKPDGTYELEIPAGTKSTIVFSNVSYELVKKSVNLTAGERRELSVTIKKKANTLTEVTVKDDRIRYDAGAVQIDARKAN